MFAGLLPHSGAENVESNKDIFGFFFDFSITNITAEKTNLRIQSTIDHLLTSKKFCEANKYTLVKITDIIRVEALFVMGCTSEA